MEKLIYHPEFITATVVKWKHLLKPAKYKNIILRKLQQMVHDDKVILYAYCIMNNHIHMIWQIKGDVNPSEIRKSFFESTGKSFKQDLIIHHPQVLELFASSQRDRSFHFWKRKSLWIELFTDKVFDQKLDYIHNNPVKAGLCNYPEEYEFSSAAFYLNGTDSWNMLTHCNI